MGYIDKVYIENHVDKPSCLFNKQWNMILLFKSERLCNVSSAGGGRQAQLHERASRGVKRTMEKVNSFVGSVHQRLRGFAPATPSQTTEMHT